jgi:diguanylate cyclase (GGDEF)-like protein
VSAHFSTSTLNDIAGSDSATARSFINAYVTLQDLQPDGQGATPEEQTKLDAQLRTLTRPKEIVRVELRLPDGRILAASEPALRGKVVPVTGDFALALGGAAQAAITEAAIAEAGPVQLSAATVLREYLPIIVEGKVLAVIGIWRDAAPILERLADVRRDVVLVTMTAGLIAAGLLFLVFRSAQGRITRQTNQIIESNRRDPLTGTLNHGALAGLLAQEIERARAAGTRIGICLIDIDNFRLLNENHGHKAGDDALLAVAEVLNKVPGPFITGRYGPDEFLLIAPGRAPNSLPAAIEGMRTSLAELSLQFESTERLPLTISAGVCSYPDNGSSVTALLAMTARTLEEAKASGGDSVRIAGPDAEATSDTSSFDVLQGLVFAVDTKDRYTKRHSEDVARYAVFLAECLGMDAEFIRTLRIAGLLHDVGKIGIPDPVLRKPGKLTDAEYEIVKQHVALGDMIVRDLPDIEVVRAGIRNHHERWDGRGYLAGLSGEDIPLVGRMLAVGDTFSAMTTSRPYRRSLGISEALRRLGDAAGTQLDERLVSEFISGIETAENPPLPEVRSAPVRLWTPQAKVA